MLKRLVLALPVIFSCGCVGLGYTPQGTLTPQGAAVQLADENIVRQCQYLGDVTGASYSVDLAREDAHNRAATMGATHLMFVSETSYQALARAYRCPVPGPTPALAPAVGAVGNDDSRVAKVRAREQAAGAAAAPAPAPAPAPADGASSDHVAKVRAREQAAGAAAATDQH
jgi:hypothetical protein